MAVKKITMRWLLNNFAVIVLIIILAIVAASISVSNYYYENIRQTLTGRADIVSSALQQMALEEADSNSQLQNYVASFSQKSLMELMTIDTEGKISLTSSGFQPDDKSLVDYERALTGDGTPGIYIGDISSVRVMALTVLLPSEIGAGISAIRLVASMENVDRQITMVVIGVVAIGIGVLILILFSSSYFISSIVNPVGRIGETARKIAGGDFGARLEKKSEDEIGELCDIINYMAGELGAADKLKNDFISSVSHELRTPLTAIQGWAETILADSGEDKSTLNRGMNVIISETARLSSMVEELLDFSRMQSGRLRLVKSKTDAVAELFEAVMMYAEKARRENIELTFDGEDVFVPVYGDKNKLRQVFVNIIDNAIKYSDSGGRVAVKASSENNMLRILVEDSGIGIKEEDLPKLKTKFFKADFTRRGSGIGLAIADEIITRHEGKLELSSKPGVGTTVEITLPAYKGTDETSHIDAAT